jgi:multiple sugar transport system substrate-binding protein
MLTAMSYPDWIDSGVICHLTDRTEAYNPELFKTDYGVVFPASHHAQLFDGCVAGLPNDGGQITLLCRSDRMGDKAKAFEDAHGRAIGVPDTWAEYHDLARFFHAPDEGFCGPLGYRSHY